MADVTIIVGGAALLQTLQRVEAKLDALLSQERQMSAELDNLAQQVQRTTDLEQSAVTLIQGLADQIKAAANDPAKIQQLAADLQARADALAASITANTPAGGGPPAPPPTGGTPAPAGGATKAP